ncbi:hypothetical protein CEUSTIGMA_g7964.t1 [Chlamydomonas eustigma]|uniref:Methyltransferase small domain-containing protein n=1 Tax=Chlamydomonas eustigma TaxID=1157962 RepID=A0A250XBV2_9CHLO|nr:hypothetical protein CEUSTIGMA_g7964.t1 [Chlamydomonas eustigma]|eukprot:GAX80526.1 hypothetical protein CEUSTIGMA_g7964.t1 [Chlamydomonas eustigma]
MLLGSWAEPLDIGDKEQSENRERHMCRILDVGTGSGLLALMMSQKAHSLLGPEFHVDAIDVDPPSCMQAQENFNNSPWRDNLHCQNVSLQEFAGATASSLDVQEVARFKQASKSVTAMDKDGGPCLEGVMIAGSSHCDKTSFLGSSPAAGYQYDTIVCNPPYFNKSTKSGQMVKDAARHADISLPFVDLARGVATLLKKRDQRPYSNFYIVLPKAAAEDFTLVAIAEGLTLVELIKVITRPSDLIEKRHLMKFELITPVRDEKSEESKHKCSNQIQASHAQENLFNLHEEYYCAMTGQVKLRYSQQYRILTERFHHPDFIRV